MDWITENLYLVIGGQERIFVCKAELPLAPDRCVELFGNEMAPRVGGLALDPNNG